MEHFVTYSDAHGRVAFLLRLARALDARMTLLTCKPSVYLAVRAAGCRALFVTRTPRALRRYPVERALECLTGELTPAAGEAFCQALAAALARIDEAVDCVLSWNGGLLADSPLTEFALARGVPRLFMEIANLPGRVFADPIGTGGDALVASHPEHMARASHGGAAFEYLREEFVAERLGRLHIPQQRRARRERLFAPLDIVASRLAGSARPQRFAPLVAMRRTLARGDRPRLALASEPVEPPARYFAYCLQVADDTNVRLRSTLSVLDGLQEAIREARDANVPLLVCPHPAERSPAALRAIADAIATEPDAHIVTGNSLEWALGAERVIVINSSIGLEVRLAGGEVKALGQSLYGRWDEDDLRNYLERWLLPIDYFDGRREVDMELLKRRFAELTSLSMSVRPIPPCTGG